MNARVLICLGALLLSGTAFAQSRPAPVRGQLLLPDFAALTNKASETMNVTLDHNLLGMVCRFLNGTTPEEIQAKKVCTSLRGVYVRHFTFDTDFAYPKGDIDALRRQLAAPGWSQIVGAKSKKENTDVNVFMLVDGEKASALSIIASQPREFTIVNIVGSIDLEQLHNLKNLGVPDLDIEAARKPAPGKPLPEKQ
jgi:hypothetical protein